MIQSGDVVRCQVVEEQPAHGRDVAGAGVLDRGAAGVGDREGGAAAVGQAAAPLDQAPPLHPGQLSDRRLCSQLRPASSSRARSPSAGASYTSLRLEAPDGDQPARIMVYSGTPLHEPVAFGGPFVMNDRRQILQAFQDFHAGEFGAVPRTARLAFDR